LEISLPRTGQELKSFLHELDVFIMDKAFEWARQVYKSIMEKIDELLVKQRPGDMKVTHRRDVWYQTCLGDIRIKRRQYRDGKKYRYLLDELTGVGKYQHMTGRVRELALELAAMMPYRQSVDVLRRTSAIDLAHQTLWRLLAKTADPYLENREKRTRHLLETGEMPIGAGKPIERLLVEADGVILSLQRENERRKEVKLGIAYEGWEQIGKDRYKTVNKTIFADITDRDSFWAAMSLKLHKRYDLGAVNDVIVGGDGANWVKEGCGYVNGRFQLDRYHLNRELCAALGHASEVKAKIWQACEQSRPEEGLKLIAEILKASHGEQAKRLSKAFSYLKHNVSGLGDYRLATGQGSTTLRRTGAIEGNVDKLIVRRMKNRGMNWTIKGIRRLICIRFLALEGNLKDWLKQESKTDTSIRVSPKKFNRIVTRLSSQEPDAWLEGRLPALYGPHASRPWAKSLKARVEATNPCL
jgi:hypothetical protein